jgi:hypothetical protein
LRLSERWRFKLSSSGLWRLHFRGEDGGSMVLRNVDILPQHYTASQPRITGIESSGFISPVLWDTKLHSHTKQVKL